MNKSSLVEIVAKKTTTKKDANEIVEEIFSSIKEELKNGGKIQLTGFGSFQVKDRKARVGRNPKTGEAVNIPARKVVKFKAAKDLI
ncbi:HU family DNA-binding protein [bacterium]